MPQLVERLLPTPEIWGSNPNIVKVLSTNCKLNRKDENKEKLLRAAITRGSALPYALTMQLMGETGFNGS